MRARVCEGKVKSSTKTSTSQVVESFFFSHSESKSKSSPFSYSILQVLYSTDRPREQRFLILLLIARSRITSRGTGVGGSSLSAPIISPSRRRHLALHYANWKTKNGKGFLSTLAIKIKEDVKERPSDRLRIRRAKYGVQVYVTGWRGL